MSWRDLTLEEFQSLSGGLSLDRTVSSGVSAIWEEGLAIKIFRRKTRCLWLRGPSQSERFMQNSRRLREREIPTVSVKGRYVCSTTGREAVVYALLPGKCLLELIENSGDADPLLDRLAAFMALLHRRGVYFRGLHMDNLLVLPDGRFALVDITDLKFRPGPLSLTLRFRNFKPLLRYVSNQSQIIRFGTDRFLKRYLDAARLSPISRLLLHGLLRVRTAGLPR